MLLIPCPYCGPRPEIEFRCGGEAHIARPAQPDEVDDAGWASYLFYRTNPKGVHAERWLHAHGCQRWFNALRDTASDRIIETYAMGATRPAGYGGGHGRTSATGVPPTPNPSPQGGGEHGRRQSHSVPSPLVGEGQGGGEPPTAVVGIPPTPNPSPRRVEDAPPARGGGEER